MTASFFSTLSDTLGDATTAFFVADLAAAFGDIIFSTDFFVSSEDTTTAATAAPPATAETPPFTTLSALSVTSAVAVAAATPDTTFPFSLPPPAPFILENGLDGFKNGFVLVAAAAASPPLPPVMAVAGAVAVAVVVVVVTDNKLVNGLFEVEFNDCDGCCSSSGDGVSGKESGGVVVVVEVIRCSSLPASLHEKCVTVTGVVHRCCFPSSRSIRLEEALSGGVAVNAAIAIAVGVIAGSGVFSL